MSIPCLPANLPGDTWQLYDYFPTFYFFQFDWEGDLPLKYPQRDLIIYEVHVRGFTRHESSKTEHRGTYLGVVEKLDHLKVKFRHFRMTFGILMNFCFR